MTPDRVRFDLFQSASHGNLEAVKDLVIKHDANVNEIHPITKFQPLHFATFGCHPEVINFLLDRGADINNPAKDLITPLHIVSLEYGYSLPASQFLASSRDGAELKPNQIISAQEGYIAVAKLLLIRGANIEAADIDGNTPLLIVAQKGNVEMFKLLLEKGADVNAQDKCRKTPIHLAARNGNVEMFKLLLEKGADVNAQDEYDFTPLHIAILYNHYKAAETLIELGADIEAQDKDGMTPLLIAAKYGNVEMFKLLLEKGANIDALANNMTPLHFAIENNHDLAAEELIRLGANIEATNKIEMTPLFIAIQKGHTQTVITLIELGANVDAVDKLGRSPLRIATEKGYAEIVELLLKKGVNVDAQDISGNTALHIAAKKGNAEIFQVLLNGKANIEILNKKGENPLQVAINNGHEDQIKNLKPKSDFYELLDPRLKEAFVNDDPDRINLLIEQGVRVDEPLNNASIKPIMIAAKNGHAKVVGALIKIDPDSIDNNGKMALHYAVENGHVEVIRILLEGKADVDWPDNKSNRPLHIAVENGHVEVIRILLEGKAEVYCYDKKGNMPLHYAVQNKNPQVFKALLPAIVEFDKVNNEDQSLVNEINKEGYTALMIAVKNGRADCVKDLIDQGATINNEFHDATKIAWDIQDELSDKAKKLQPTQVGTRPSQILDEKISKNEEIIKLLEKELNKLLEEVKLKEKSNSGPGANPKNSKREERLAKNGPASRGSNS